MKKSIFFGLMAAVCVLASCDKVKEAVDEIKEGNREPAIENSADGLQTTLSFKVVGIAEFTFDVKYGISQIDTILYDEVRINKGDTLVKSATTTEKFFLKELADDEWEEVEEMREETQRELERVLAQMEKLNPEDKDYQTDLIELQMDAAAYQIMLEDFTTNYKRDDKTITINNVEFIGTQKKFMEPAIQQTFKSFQKAFNEMKNLKK